MSRIVYEADATGFSKLEAVSKYWGFIQEENEAQRHLVSGYHWNQWSQVNGVVSTQLSNLIDDYNGSYLTNSAVQQLDRLIERIESAPHKSGEELEEEIAQRRAELELKTLNVSNKEVVKQKKSFLKAFFKRD